MGKPNKIIDVEKLNEAAIQYDSALRQLPFMTIREAAAAIGFNVMELSGRHALINKRRHAGLTMSYVPGKTIVEAQKLIGYDPSVIEPKTTAFTTKENVLSYDENTMLLVGGKPVDNKTKKHPLEQTIVFDMATSHGEDIVSAMMHAERSDESTSPAGCMDGLYTKVDMEIATGDVNAARGNFAVTGELLRPTSESDTEAYDILVEFIGGASTYLRNSAYGIPHLIISETALKAAWDAFKNKTRLFQYATMQNFIENLRADSFCQGLVISTHPALGTGSRLILEKIGNIDLAINTQSANRFVQIRNIDVDPNIVQFWLQAGYDTRVRDIHEKIFRTNEQKNEGNHLLLGDYCETGGIQINLSGDDGKGKWYEQGQIKKHGSGQYLVGLKPGSHTITFDAVGGKNKPSDQKITVEAGKVTVAEAKYTPAM